MKTYRNNGAVGALLDEYEKALNELQDLISGISPSELCHIVDPHTDDEWCRSIQTILSHVISAGYNYAIVIRKSQGESLEYYSGIIHNDLETYQKELKKMFSYTARLFYDYPKLPLEAYASENKILVRWGQLYDVEQLMEHAICHILRHRRQIERFLQKLQT